MIPVHSIKTVSKIFAQTFADVHRARRRNVDMVALKKQWAKKLVGNFQIDVQVEGEVSEDPSTLFVGNHISYVDIPVLMSVVKDLTFVAKAEIKNWPVIGAAASKAGTVFVKRDSGNSRLDARHGIKSALIDGKRIAVFPSGTTTLKEELPWKVGAFKIANEAGAKIQPFRITYTPKREVAYIDDDIIMSHVFNLTKVPSILAKVEFHTPTSIIDPVQDCKRMQDWVCAGIAD